MQFFIHNPAPLTDSPLPIILFKVKKYLTSKENRRLALLVNCTKSEVSKLGAVYREHFFLILDLGEALVPEAAAGMEKGLASITIE